MAMPMENFSAAMLALAAIEIAATRCLTLAMSVFRFARPV
jgi:acyl-CoA hydrolase